MKENRFRASTPPFSPRCNRSRQRRHRRRVDDRRQDNVADVAEHVAAVVAVEALPIHRI